MLALHRPRRHHSTLRLEEARHHSDLKQNKDYTEPRVLRDTEFVTCNPSRAISACVDSPANSRDFCPIFAQAARIFAFSCCDLQLGGQCLIYTVIRIVSLLVGCLNVEHREFFPAVLRNMNWTCASYRNAYACAYFTSWQTKATPAAVNMKSIACAFFWHRTFKKNS